VLRREIARLMQERDDGRLNAAAAAKANAYLEERLETTAHKLEATVLGLRERPRPAGHRLDPPTGADDMRAHVDLLESQVAELRALNREQRHLIEAIYASSSWRVAAPLRRLTTMMRRLSGKPVSADTPPPEVARLPGAVSRASSPDEAAASRPEALPYERLDLRQATPKRNGRGDLLVAADMPPLFDQQAGGLRLSTLLGMMAEAGWTLTFASLLGRQDLPEFFSTAEGMARYEGTLRRQGVRRILYGMPEIDAYLKETTTQVDWAFLSFPSVASNIMPLVRARFPRALVAFDMVDFHGVRMIREAELQDDSMKLAEAKRMRDEELGLALAADVTVAVSDDDRNTLLALAPLAVVKVVPCIFDVPSTPPPSLCNRAGLFFIGGFWHTPNGDGIKWFVERILPLIQAEIPDVVLRIAGSNMGDDILALGVLPGVEVLGFVPEVEPLLDQHRVFIAPLRFGAGMKGKVAQSLANGLPVVATKIGAEGMTLVPGTHILVADEETRFADEVVRLLRDDDLWQRLSKQGRSHIESTLSRKIVSEQLGALLDG
jgi:glycosyltransferase involved in cell wall biosynthesis